MNIFVLDSSPYKAAQYHCDKHVVKMILETAQLISTTHHVLDGADSPIISRLYKPTHMNHPSAVWVRESIDNYMWLINLFVALHSEWQYRWDHSRAHSSFTKLMDTEFTSLKVTAFTPPKYIPRGPETPFKLCMPEEYKDEHDPVQSYRDYYVNEKADLLKYTKRAVPFWIADHEARMGGAQDGR